jgi:NAD(P)-dependent dehydrogenase (short-subunit alcohol dehydrogenase family)
MSRKDSAPTPDALERYALERRRFLSEGSTYGVGAMGLLAGLGISRSALAQNNPPPAAGAPPARPAPPPEPKESQPAPLRDLKGKVAYVTASSDGIGLGIARAAANAGMKVCVGYRNEERLKAALPLFKKGSAVLPVKHDVTDRDGWAKALEQIKKEFGKLHLVVNNAGSKTRAKISEVSYTEWDNALAVNFTSTQSAVAVCLPHMLEHGEGGHFVVTSSMSGILPGANLGVYTATKIAVVGLIEALRIELEGTKIGTSAFVPGGVNTDNYLGTGEENPFRAANAPAGAPPRPPGPPPGMDPLEAGERVLNGVIHNDLFIVTHPEYMPGTQQRFDAMLASNPVEDTPPPEARLRGEVRTMRAGIYPREIAHRQKKRKSHRSVKV